MSRGPWDAHEEEEEIWEEEEPEEEEEEEEDDGLDSYREAGRERELDDRTDWDSADSESEK